MALVRYVPVLLGGLICAAPSSLPAQQSTGAISGKVVDAATQEPLSGVFVRVDGTRREAASRSDGGFTISDVSAGTYKIRATRIGYALLIQDVTVTGGATVNVDLALRPAAAILEPVVVTGYGSQRREAITGT